MDREDSGGTASQSHSFPLAARTLVSTPGLPVKVFPWPRSLFLGKKLTRSLLSTLYTGQDLVADWMKGTEDVFVHFFFFYVYLYTQINVVTHMLMHAYACVGTLCLDEHLHMCACVNLLMHANAVHDFLCY